MRYFSGTTCLFLIVGISAGGFADPPPGEDEANKSFSLSKLSRVTLGSKQFWTDETHYAGWRIQRNVLTSSYRLLDDNNSRLTHGTFETCRDALQTIKANLVEPERNRTVVLLLHGLVRSRNSMKPLATFLKATGQFEVINISYASSQETIDQHAQSLGTLINRLEGVSQIHFVAHSMGNLVIRRYLRDCQDGKWKDRKHPKVSRMVMLGPPNQGSQIAKRFKDYSIFKYVWGISAQQLAEDWDELNKRLAIPPCEFGIIAGGRGQASGRNPLLQGDNDFIVSVEETKLPGAHDFLILPVLHSFMMEDAKIMAHTLQFLRNGYFVSEPRRQPIKR